MTVNSALTLFARGSLDFGPARCEPRQENARAAAFSLNPAWSYSPLSRPCCS